MNSCMTFNTITIMQNEILIFSKKKLQDHFPCEVVQLIVIIIGLKQREMLVSENLKLLASSDSLFGIADAK